MFDLDAQCAKAIATLDQLSNRTTPVVGIPVVEEEKEKHVPGTLTLTGDEIGHAAGVSCYTTCPPYVDGGDMRTCESRGFICAPLECHALRKLHAGIAFVFSKKAGLGLSVRLVASPQHLLGRL